jgi:hypothetical protein
MTKRTAMLMAAGVVAALLGGSVALSFGLSGGGTAAAETPRRLEPIVRTVHRTVRVEKEAKGPAEPIQVVTVSSDPAQTELEDDAFEDGFEDESEDHGSEDHEEDDDDDHEDESGDD